MLRWYLRYPRRRLRCPVCLGNGVDFPAVRAHGLFVERYSALRSIEIQSFFTELSSRFACRGVHEYYSYEAVYPSLW